MSKLSRRDLLLSGAAAASLQLRAQTKAAVVTSLPPVARVDPVEDIYFGTRVIDPYRWMEIQPHSEEFNSWMKAEAAFAKDQLDALPHRDEINASLRTYLADVDVAFLSAVAGDNHFIFQIPKGSSTGQLYLLKTRSKPLKMASTTRRFWP